MCSDCKSRFHTLAKPRGYFSNYFWTRDLFLVTVGFWQKLGEAMTRIFRKFAERVANAAGTPWAFTGALAILVSWGASGPVFGFSEHWQLIINSFTTIVTFLMVFIIQNTQNRDFKAMQIKLDALLAANEKVPKGLLNLHNLEDDELDRLERAVEGLAGDRNIDAIVRTFEKMKR
jgi:low affinity Fe/Cu permease